MNCREFTKLPNIKYKLLFCFDIVGIEERYIKLEMLPDFNKTNYQRRESSNYQFNTKWRFPHYMKFVSDFSFGDRKIYTNEDLIAMGMPSYHTNEDDEEALLTRLLIENSKLLDEHGFDVDEFPEFSLQYLGLREIDNGARFLLYEGIFKGDDYHMDASNWPVFAAVSITFMPMSVSLELYLELMAESYLLSTQGKENLSYFMLHAALENFVNYELAEYDIDGNESKEYLYQKIEKLFQRQPVPLKDNQVYIAIRPMLDKFRGKRNIIAHGKERVDLKAADIQLAWLATLIMILSIKSDEHTFNGLKGILKEGKKLSDFY